MALKIYQVIKYFKNEEISFIFSFLLNSKYIKNSTDSGEKQKLIHSFELKIQDGYFM